MGRKAIEKRDNQLIINIDEIEREQQAPMLTKSNDLIHAKFNASLFVQKLLNFSLGVYCEAAEWGDIQRGASGRPAECDGSVRHSIYNGSVGSGGTNIEF